MGAELILIYFNILLTLVGTIFGLVSIKLGWDMTKVQYNYPSKVAGWFCFIFPIPITIGTAYMFFVSINMLQQ